MTLNKNLIDIPLNGGVNQLVNPKLLPSTQMHTVHNGRYIKDGGIDKVAGFTKLSAETAAPSALTSWGNELLKFTSGILYSYSDTTVGDWSSKGAAPIAKTALSKLSGSPVAASGVDVIQQDGIQLSVWLSGSNYNYSIVELETDALVQTGVFITGTACYPRLVSVPGYIYIFYNNTTNLIAKRFSTANTGSNSSTTITAVMHTDGMFDVASYGSYIYVAYRLAAGDVKISKLTAALTADASNSITSLAPDSAKQFTIDVSDGVNLFLASVESLNIYMSVNLLANLSPITAKTLVTTTATSAVNVVMGQYTALGIYNKQIYFTLTDGTGTYNYTTYRVEVSTTVVAIAEVFMRSVGVASKPYRLTNGKLALIILHESALQATYFLMDSDRSILAKFVPGEGGTHTAVRRPSNFYGGVFGLLRKGRIQSENATLFAVLNPQVATVDFAPDYVTLSTESGMLIAGGALRNYDGVSVTEYGFHLYPENVSLGQSNTVNGVIPNGTYLVSVIYEWTDAQGVRNQSAPSVPVSITTTGANNTITVTAPSLRITGNTNQYLGLTLRSDILVRAFITENNGSVFYYNASVTNNVSTDTVAVVLTAATSTSNELLYTNGGALENIAAPSHGYAFLHNNHVVITDLEDPNQVRFSKDIKPLTGVGFNEDFSINMDPIGGRCVAGATLNGTMIIFKETATYVIPGQFPNDIGLGSSLDTPRQISGTIGLRDVKSVIESPTGVYFMSNQGLYLIDKYWNLVYLGGPVSDNETDTIIAANNLLSSREIRFLTDAGKTLTLNLTYNRWSTSDSINAVDATVWGRDQFAYATDTKILVEDPTTFLNDGSYVSMTIRTSWVHLQGLQGFQRIYMLGLLGTYYTNNAFYIKLRYDYSDIVRETSVVTASSIVNTSTWGDGATWGSDNYWGGSEQDEVYQLRKQPIRQKCEAISVEISDSPAGTGSNGQGYSLESLSLLVGGKGGIFRNSSTRSI